MLLWLSSKPTWAGVELLERKLKNLSWERKLKFMRKYGEEIQEGDVY